jgi:hypothetical protein
MTEPAPIVIRGIPNIAKTIGFSPDFVRAALIGKPDFPARKEGRLWITTRRLLEDWADGMIQPPRN